jgi:hypothetical protein
LGCIGGINAGLKSQRSNILAGTALRRIGARLPSVYSCEGDTEPLGELLLGKAQLVADGSENWRIAGLICHVCDICDIAFLVNWLSITISFDKSGLKWYKTRTLTGAPAFFH